jgi:tripartite-type tricarboxylate transporter receptor subunit TctC
MRPNLIQGVMVYGLSILPVLWAGLPAAHAQGFPSKPIRLIVPFPPGGTTDVLGRLWAKGMGEDLGQSVLVDNRPGAGGRLGTEAVAKAPADAYTLLLASTSNVPLAEVLYPKLPYDAVKSFASVGIGARLAMIVVVNAAVPAQSLKELIDYAKANPGKLNYGSIGIGTAPHMVGEHFRVLTKTELVHVAFQGAAPMTTALISGDVQVTFDLLAAQMLGHVKAGKVRVLAVLAGSRSAQLPGVPTSAEAGLPDLRNEPWWGLSATGGSPGEAVRRLSVAMRKATATKETVDAMNAYGMQAGEGTPEQMDQEIKSDVAKWSKVNEVVRIKLE